MPFTPQQEISRLVVRAAGSVFILVGLWEGAQPGNSILFLAVFVGFLLLFFPGALAKR